MGQYHLKQLKNMKMTVLDVIDLDKIWTVNSMCEKKFFEPWGNLGTTLVCKV